MATAVATARTRISGPTSNLIGMKPTHIVVEIYFDNQGAMINPATAPLAESAKDSNSKGNIIRALLAPNANLRAISNFRSVVRANIRLAKLAQAVSSTTAANDRSRDSGRANSS